MASRALSYLNAQAFFDKEKGEAHERQKGVLVKCGKKFDIGQLKANQVEPWREGGKTNAGNCRTPCKADN